jgi:hypothetical protein
MSLSRFSFALVGLAAFGVACSNDEGTPAAADPYAKEIGPEGGELVIPETDLLFGGTKVKIAPGALSQKVLVRVEAVTDPTPLPDGAERVGPQLSIGPAGTTLATPLEVTFPLDEALFPLFDQKPDGCKVWFRKEAGWARAEQTASTPTTVTVALSAFGVAAAGVLSTGRVSLCVTSPATCRGLVAITPAPPTPAPPPCVSATGFCVVKIPNPTFSIYDQPSLTVAGNKVYYLHSPGPNRITVVRYDIATGMSVLFTELANAAITSVRGQIAVDSAGDAWVGLAGVGNVRFKQSAAPTKFEFSSAGPVPNGVIVIGERVLRYTLEQRSAEGGRRVYAQIEGATTREAFGNFDGRKMAMVERKAPAPLDAVAFAAGPGLRAFNTQTTTPGVLLGLANTSDMISVATSKTSGLIGMSKSGSFAAQPRGVKRFSADEFTPLDFDLSGEAGAMTQVAFDDDDLLYGVNADRAEFLTFDAEGGLTNVRLTDAAPDTPTYARLLPRILRQNATKKEVFLATAGTAGVLDFHVIRKP